MSKKIYISHNGAMTLPSWGGIILGEVDLVASIREAIAAVEGKSVDLNAEVSIVINVRNYNPKIEVTEC